MKLHPADLVAIVGYVAGGGLGATGAVLAIIFPGHAALIVAIGLAVASLAGLVRTLINRTPPVGTVAAVIPANTVPVVLAGAAAPSGVAVIDSTVVASLTRA